MYIYANVENAVNFDFSRKQRGDEEKLKTRQKETEMSLYLCKKRKKATVLKIF